MKHLISVIVGAAVFASGALFVYTTQEPVQDALGGFAGGFANGAVSVWKQSAGIISPQNSSWTLRLPYLTSEDCIGTDADGDLQAGTCTGGSSFGQAWSLITNTFSQSALAPTTTQNIHVSGTGTSTFSGGLEAWRQIAAPYFHATSSTASDFSAGGIIGDVVGNLTGNVTGNADTATALASNGSNCSSGNAPLGVDALGASEGCFDVWTEAENTSAAYISNITGENITDLSDVGSVDDILGTTNQITVSGGANTDRDWETSF